MKIYSEITLDEFNAWSGTVDTKNKIIEADKSSDFNDLIEELYPDGIEETELNDILSFEKDWLFESLGINE
jgi:hypothetical protein